MNENWGNTFVPLPFHLHTQTTHPEAAMSLMKTTFCALVASSSLAACSTMDGWDPSQRNAAIGGALGAAAGAAQTTASMRKGPLPARPRRRILEFSVCRRSFCSSSRTRGSPRTR